VIADFALISRGHRKYGSTRKNEKYAIRLDLCPIDRTSQQFASKLPLNECIGDYSLVDASRKIENLAKLATNYAAEEELIRDSTYSEALSIPQ
jgi:hypothetical protein